LRDCGSEPLRDCGSEPLRDCGNEPRYFDCRRITLVSRGFRVVGGVPMP
jgi:hypothetical protein